MATFSAQITDLVGGTIDQDACDQWAVDGAREIIFQLPVSMQEKCSDKSTLSDSPTTLDLDTATIGKVLYCTRNNGSYDIPCRLVESLYAHLTDDSTSTNYYAVADDPAYFIRDNLVEIKPTPTGSQNGFVYHVLYPSSINVDGVSAIASFPIECEHLLVLYISTKQLLQFQSTMTTSFNSDITTAFTATNTELDETQAICDKVDADLVLAKAEIVLAKAEAAELASNTDNASNFETACDAMVTELDKVDDIIVEASAEFDKVDNVIVEGSAEFDKVDNVIVEGSVELDKSTALLDLGEADSEGAVNTAAGKIITELDDTRAICDDVGTSADSAITALGNMATEIALANQEVDDALVEIAEAIGLVDNASNIQVAVDGMKTAVAKFRADNSNPGLFGDPEWFTTGANVGMTKVKVAVDRAVTHIIGNFPDSDSHLEQVLADINDQVTAEDTELAASFMQEAQTTISAAQLDLQIAQTHISEWNATVQTLVSEINAFAAEAQARYGWINAKAVVWQGELSAAQGYMGAAGGYANQASGFNSTAQAYASEAQTRIGLANGYIAEINVRLAQAGAKRQESQARLAAGSAYIQEANAIVGQGNAYLQEASSIANQGNSYLSEAQAVISQAQGYAAEVSARSTFAGAKTQAIQGHISTAQSYVATAQGFGSEVQTKIAIANGYVAEAGARLQADTAKYGWYGDQYAKLSAEYVKGLAALKEA